VIWTIIFALGLGVGLVVGRWWALAAALATGIWITMSSGVDEVPPWFLGLVYSGFAEVGIAFGVLARRRLRRAGPLR
jgi:hypothetical protein